MMSGVGGARQAHQHVHERGEQWGWYQVSAHRDELVQTDLTLRESVCVV